MNAPFPDTITIKRNVKGAQDSLGEKSNTLTAIHTDIPARLESWSSSTEYKSAGQRPVTRTVVYVRPNIDDIQTQDEIYVDDVKIGTVNGVNPALSPNPPEIDHYELSYDKP